MNGTCEQTPTGQYSDISKHNAYFAFNVATYEHGLQFLFGWICMNCIWCTELDKQLHLSGAMRPRFLRKEGKMLQGTAASRAYSYLVLDVVTSDLLV